jgi:CRISPR system Cascade subunit CasD
VLYLGRKACVPAAPLWPQCIQASSAYEAFSRYAQQAQEAIKQAPSAKGPPLLTPLPPLELIAFDDHIQVGLPIEITTRRKDRLIHRGSWQFGDRNEHIAWVDAPPTPATAED